MDNFRIAMFLIGVFIYTFSFMLLFLSNTFWLGVKKIFMGGGFWRSYFFSNPFWYNIEKKRYRISVGILLLVVGGFFIFSAIA